MMWRKGVRGLVTAGAMLGTLTDAMHARALGEQGEPIDTSDYTIDLYEGPTLASSRIVGLAGAYAPIAEGVAGYSYNPAAVAVRVPWSQKSFDWELDGGITLPSSITNFDFDNNGDDRFANEAGLFLTGGGGLRFDHLGIGASVEFSTYRVNSLTEDRALNVNVTSVLAVVGYGFFHNQLLAGIGVALENVGITNVDGGQIASVSGPAGYVGVLWAPIPLPIRVGASVRWTPPASSLPDSAPGGVEPDDDGNYVSEGFILPRTVSLPTEIRAGIAFQFFRPLNFGWLAPKHDPHMHTYRVERANEEELAGFQAERARRLSEAEASGTSEAVLEQLDETLERAEEKLVDAADDRLDEAKEADRQRRLRPYKTMPREKLLISAAMRMTTITTNGVGLESFIRQEVERSGEKITVTPHLGVEGEAIPGYLVLRGGSYYEPTRFRTGSARLHGTFGLDVHIPLEWGIFGLLDDDTTFRVGGAIDGAPRYFGWGVSAGLWR